MGNILERMESALEQRAREDALRSLKLREPNSIDFTSNDYLGIARDNVLESNSSGSGGSRLLAGNSKAAEDAENEIASWCQAEAALIFPSAYMANIGLLSAVVGRNDTVVFDKLCHASIRDGIVLSKANSFGFNHNDPSDCASKLEKANGEKFIVVEALYSMEGDWAPIEALVELARHHDARLIVDEAHSIGIVGGSGEGLIYGQEMVDEVFARTMGFGKAVGFHGGAVLGSAQLQQYLTNYSRPFIYTTAMPEGYYTTLMEAVHQTQVRSDARQALRDVIAAFEDAFAEFGARRNGSPIGSLTIGGNEKTRNVALQLQGQGFWCLPILSPTVPEGSERIRVSLHAYNTIDEVERLASAVKELV